MKAMLLAAGRGERMRPLTDHTPKPLLQAGGKPLIVWHIENLARAGIRDIIINHAHLGSQIEAALGDGSSFDVRIRYSPENPVLETAGGIANALPLLGEAAFAVINSDIYCDYDFTRLPHHAATLKASGDAAHLVLVDNPMQHPNGDFCLDADRIKPTPPGLPNPPAPLSGGEPGEEHEREARSPLTRGVRGVEVLTFSGIGIYLPSLFASIPRGAAAPLAPLLRVQIAHNKVSGEHYTGRWVDVGTPQRLEQLDNMLRATHNASHA